MMNDDFEPMDDLDQALFALPLDEPPHGLRASILSATIYAVQPRAVAVFRTWELWAGGAAMAVATWLCIALVAYKNFRLAFNDQLDGAIVAFSQPSTILWFALGCALTGSLWYIAGANLRTPFRGARS